MKSKEAGLWYIIKKFQGYRYIILLFFVSSAATIRDLACGITLAIVTNAVIYGGNVIGSILWVTIAMFSGVPLKGLETYLKNRYKIHGQCKLSKEMAEHAALLHIKHIEKNGTGDTLSRYTTDLDKLLGWFTDVLPAIIRLITYIPGAMIYGLSQSVLLTLVSMPVIIVVTPLIVKISKPIQKLSDTERQATSKTLSQIQEVLLDPELIKAYSLEDSMMKRLEKSLHERQCSEQKSAIYIALVRAFSLVTSYFPGLLAASFGAIFLFQGKITVGFLIAFVQMAMGRFGYVLPQIGNFSEKTRKAISAAARISDLFHAECERKDGKTTIPENNKRIIEFNHVYFSYEGKEGTLKDINLYADKGETIALVGNSGCGKSTIVKLLLGFYDPSGGMISVMGRPLPDWNLEALRSLFAPVFQEVFLFPGSINENIAGESGDTYKIMHALQNAGLDTFVSTLPNGSLTTLYERGMNLSGGQKQRMTIARAFYKNSPILILDEPTSALDTVTETELHYTLKKLCRNKTTVIIAHNLQMVQNADRIYVIDDGNIVEFGTHDELLGKSGTYSHIYAQQNTEVVV